ncbi:MAG TPA: hypothetical protein ENK46_06925 [Flavobacteriia bacterium]|jgi:thiamine kinase-like enzyme|nr:hypothetical protein [Flavobacteriia bacterium]
MEKKLFYFPKQQSLCLLYSDVNILKNRLFNALSIQVSPKNSLAFRMRKTRIGHFLFTLFFKKKQLILQLPNDAIKMGYINNQKKVIFEFDKDNKPVYVYKETGQHQWKRENFIGYTLIEAYSKQEYFKKIVCIEKALEKRWKEIPKTGLHGDFTHLNILIDTAEKLVFIDEKRHENSLLFDHFYFYSYYVQCLEKCVTIDKNEVEAIKKSLQQLIKKICKTDTKKQLLTYLNAITTDKAYGLQPEAKQQRLQDFKDFMGYQ